MSASKLLTRHTIFMSQFSARLQSVIAIEGPSGSGKTTLLRGLHHRYRCDVIEVGMVVRAVAWWAESRRVSIPDAVAALATLERKGRISLETLVESTELAAMSLRFADQHPAGGIFGPAFLPALEAAALDKEGMTWVHSFVREHLRGQRTAVSGREVGSRTLPGVRLVIRLTAEESVRKTRKLTQLRGAGVAPLWSDDAVLLGSAPANSVPLDTTALTPKAVLDRVGVLVESRLGWPRPADTSQSSLSGSIS